MGLNNQTTEQMGTKLSIVGGAFTIRVPEGTAGAEPRKLTKGKNEGKEVWELKYQSLSNVYLAAGTQVDGEYPGADVVFRDADSGDEYTVNFPLDSGYLYQLIRSLPNVDTSKPFNIELHASKKKTKTGTVKHDLRLAQFGKLLGDFYVEWKKDAQGKNVPTPLHGIPEPKQGPRGWDWRDVEDFLLLQFQDFFDDYQPSIPTNIDTGNAMENQGGYDRHGAQDDVPEDEFDDSEIPF